MKILKKILIALLLVLVVMQFFRPTLNESDTVTASDIIVATNPPADIGEMLKTSCYDCHSNHTKYPWYNNIAPISYWLSDHVKDGKKHLNFSEWENYSLKRKAHKMEELAEEVGERHMPLNSYLWVHTEARMSEEQIDQMTQWAKSLQLKYELEEKQPSGLLK